MELMLVWQQLANRLSLSSQGTEAAQLMLRAIKLAVSSLRSAPRRPDGRLPAQRAITNVMLLADLLASGVPLCTEDIAAAVIADAVAAQSLPVDIVEAQLGKDVCARVHAILRVRSAPDTVDVYDDASASALRDVCLTHFSVNAIVVEVACKLDELQNMRALPLAKQHQLALQVRCTPCRVLLRAQLIARCCYALGLTWKILQGS